MTAPQHQLHQLQTQWDSEAAAARLIRRVRRAGPTRATASLSLLVTLALALGLLIPALVAACTRIPA